jgi:hypothetical protein
MTDSVTFQAILERGRAQGIEQGRLQEAINVLMRLGSKRFGPPNASTNTTIAQISDLSRIDRFIDQLDEVNTWSELLALPEEGNGNDSPIGKG